MKDRPIIFSGPMVRAILSGTKTQTRRIVKCPAWSGADNWNDANLEVDPHGKPATVCANTGCFADITSPYGEPGNLLWVREAFYVQPDLWADGHGLQPIDYVASSPADQLEDYVLKPSIHMPRWASRITLKITAVRVERLQDITEEDAVAEGAAEEFRTVIPLNGKPIGCTKAYSLPISYRAGFANLWDRINADRGFGWDMNPWVWALSFRRIDASIAAA